MRVSGGPPLVTGATGFAGRHLVEHLLAFEPSVAAWANPSGQQPPDDSRVQWRAVDLLDRAAVVEAIADLAPAAIYHCAGFADVAGAWARPEKALRINVLGTHYLLDAVRCTRLSCPVLLTGSALIYRQSQTAIAEDSPIGPSSPYGLSKLAQERLGLRTTSVPVIVTRPFNHAGPRQSPAYVTSAFARQIAEIEARRLPPVIRVGNLDSRRDITDVRDTVRAYRLLVRHGKPQRPYNVCSGRAHRIGDLLDMLVSMSRERVRIEIDPARLRPADNPLVLGDASRLVDETGWRPEIPIDRTLADLLEHWRAVAGTRES
jgi:GDP-4-dehydro-6-deoxy-D-mannose reductase